MAKWIPDRHAQLKSLALLFGGGGIYIGLWVLVGIAARETSFSSPTAEVWRAMVAAQGVLWAGAVWLVLDDVWTLMRSRPLVYWLYAVTVVLALVAAQVIPNALPELVLSKPDFTLLGGAMRTFLQSFVAAGCLLAGLVAAVIGTSYVEALKREPTQKSLALTRHRLWRSGTVLSVILVVAVASTSWLQRSFEVAFPGSYPEEVVLSYGLYFTALLFVVYLPAILQLYRSAAWFAEQKYPSNDDDDTVFEKRHALLSKLGITTGGAVQAALAALSPIVSAVLSLALEK